MLAPAKTLASSLPRRSSATLFHELFATFLAFLIFWHSSFAVLGDKDLNLLTILSSNSTQNLTYGYDNAGNLTNITDSLAAANSQTLTYDVIDRLTGATSGAGGYGTLAFAWDKNANRTSHTIAGTATTYTTAASTNRLTALGAQAITTNANGSVTGFSPAQPSGLATLAYNAAGRVASASSASATLLTNTYDATGMRAQKVAGSTTSRFVRGLGAELLQEVTGTTRRNYIYANGLPIAQLNGTTLHYLHTDQRGAPTVATNASKTVRWSTRYDPFGATVGLTNPGSLVMNLRLPGQYADSETGLYDNGFRTYNAATGRYLQSDPIGLAGGTNTYGYVGGNPFRWVDPSGLINDGLCARTGLPEDCADLGTEYPPLTPEERSEFYQNILFDTALLCFPEIIASEAILGKTFAAVLRDEFGGSRAGDFTRSQKKMFKQANAEKNGGTMKCDRCKKDLESIGNKKGEPTPQNQAQIHHDPEIQNGGGRDSDHEILCPTCHIAEHNPAK